MLGSDTKEVKEEQVVLVEGTYRSKDAGKTCKERFSFSSSDAGATVLKTSPGAKNPNAILVENKDSYMLLECHTKNKFVIVELSDDILIDTVVLANYEFFSSMIRKFRVSVSARYPVKLDKWVELGVFEARNSRDIQPFLVQHPQIYTKYLRIEFLSHYGTEYYCPVSLLRVHGTRMLDTWKEPDTSHEDEAEETIEALSPEQDEEVNVTEVEPSGEPDPSGTDQNLSHMVYVGEMGLSPWQPLFEIDQSHDLCMASSPTTTMPTPASLRTQAALEPLPQKNRQLRRFIHQGLLLPRKLRRLQPLRRRPLGLCRQTQPRARIHPDRHQQLLPTIKRQRHNDQRQQPRQPETAPATSKHHRPPDILFLGEGIRHLVDLVAQQDRHLVHSTGSLPTVQESFFKAVTKRLQHLETNTSSPFNTSKISRASCRKPSRKWKRGKSVVSTLSLIASNKTVLSELRNVRTQYDQIWQSTVIALETQREQNEREIVALSTRLNILADEVVFQKRMAILQSVLLLSCLVLAIFSRGYVPSPLDNLGMNPQAALCSGFGIPSLPVE